MSRRFWKDGLVIAAATALAGGCQREPSAALIHFVNPGNSDVRRVVEAVLDSLDRDARVPVRLVSSDRRIAPGEPRLILGVHQALASAKNPDVVAAVGPPGSSDVMSVGPVFRDAGIPMVVPTANAPQLARLGAGIYLMAPPLDEEVRFIGEFVAGRLGAEAVTIIYNPGAWGGALQAQLAAELWQRGLRVLGPVPVPLINCASPGVTLSRYVASVLRLGRPDVVVVASYESCLIREFERQAPGITFVAADGLVIPTGWPPGQGDLAARIHAVSFRDPAASSAVAERFRRLFEEVSGRPPTWGDAALFDATMVLVHAVYEAGPSRAAVARYLAQLGQRRPAFDGVTGPISFFETRRDRLAIEGAAPSAVSRP